MIGFLSRKVKILWKIFQIDSTNFQICAHSKHSHPKKSIIIWLFARLFVPFATDKRVLTSRIGAKSAKDWLSTACRFLNSVQKGASQRKKRQKIWYDNNWCELRLVTVPKGMDVELCFCHTNKPGLQIAGRALISFFEPSLSYEISMALVTFSFGSVFGMVMVRMPSSTLAEIWSFTTSSGST